MRPLTRRTVLVIEDDKDLRTLYCLTLKSAGFQVQATDDGIAALKLIEHTPPDAIVLDLRLPTLDGVSVRHELAAHAHTQHIPVVVVTGSAIDARDLNIAALLRKPIEPDALVAAVRNALRPVLSPASEGARRRLPDDR